MRFHEMDLTHRTQRHRIGRRVLDGFVQGHADCWVVVARDERTASVCRAVHGNSLRESCVPGLCQIQTQTSNEAAMLQL